MKSRPECSNYRREIHARIEGLEPASDLEQHLLDCDGCQQILRELAAIDDALMRSIEPPPEGLTRRVLDVCSPEVAEAPVTPSPGASSMAVPSLAGSWLAGAIGAALAVAMGAAVPSEPPSLALLLPGWFNPEWPQLLPELASNFSGLPAFTPSAWPTLLRTDPWGPCAGPLPAWGGAVEMPCALLVLGVLLGLPAVRFVLTPQRTSIPTSTRRSS